MSIRDDLRFSDYANPNYLVCGRVQVCVDGNWREAVRSYRVYANDADHAKALVLEAERRDLQAAGHFWPIVRWYNPPQVTSIR